MRCVGRVGMGDWEEHHDGFEESYNLVCLLGSSQKRSIDILWECGYVGTLRHFKHKVPQSVSFVQPVPSWPILPQILLLLSNGKFMTNEALMCFNIFCSLVASSEVMARSFNQEDWCLLVVIWQCTLSSKISTCQSSKKNPIFLLSFRCFMLFHNPWNGGTHIFERRMGQWISTHVDAACGLTPN